MQTTFASQKEIVIRQLPDGNYQAYYMQPLSMPIKPEQLLFEVQQWQYGQFTVTIEPVMLEEHNSMGRV